LCCCCCFDDDRTHNGTLSQPPRTSSITDNDQRQQLLTSADIWEFKYYVLCSRGWLKRQLDRPDTAKSTPWQ
jgi:hypothetical protein